METHYNETTLVGETPRIDSTNGDSPPPYYFFSHYFETFHHIMLQNASEAVVIRTRFTPNGDSPPQHLERPAREAEEEYFR